MIYDQPSNASFFKKIESVQYNVAQAVTGVVTGSSREKLYQELGLEHLYQRRWARRLCLLHKVFSVGQPPSTYDLLLPMRSSRRHVNSFNTFSCKSEYFKNSFIPNVIHKWNKLDPDLCEHKFRHGFRDILNPLCPCSIETETTAHYFCVAISVMQTGLL